MRSEGASSESSADISFFKRVTNLVVRGPLTGGASMVSLLTLIFQIAGLGLGIYRIWPEAVYLHAAAQAETGLAVTSAIEAGEHILLSFSLVLLPFMDTLNAVTGSRFYGALKVLVFSGLCVIMAHVLHSSIIDGYVFYLSQNRQWISLALPAGVFVVVAVNWLIAFAELRRAIAGK